MQVGYSKQLNKNNDDDIDCYFAFSFFFVSADFVQTITRLFSRRFVCPFTFLLLVLFAISL